MTPDDDLKRIAADSSMDQAVAGATSCARMVAASVVAFHATLTDGGVSEELRFDLTLQYAAIYTIRFFDQMNFGASDG